MSKYINTIEALYNSNIIDVNHISRYRKEYERSNLDERKILDATCNEIFKDDINKLHDDIIKKLSAESKKRISSPTLKKPTPPISKLEERRKEQGKQGKTGRNIIIAIIVIGVIVVFAITPSKKEEACTCVSLWDNYQNKGGMFSTPSWDVQIEIDRCAKRFDGMNNARRMCNE
ncbi:MAG: hypothetical protein IIC74_00955 [Bacteroidetes bacterium]|nr:hypothetical protein [Bacteroidota bacterium]